MPFADLRRKPNLMLLITDQQSGHPHWPAGWEEANLPSMQRLRETGLSFERGYTNSCTCSPSRVTMLTGLYPAQHGVTEVLEFDNSGRVEPLAEDGTVKAGLVIKEHRQRGLSAQTQNLARIMKSAGYNVIFKGKWHLTKPVQYSLPLDQKYWTDADIAHIAERYGFDGWTMPDAGDNLAIANMGGGTTNNDGRFVNGRGLAASYGSSIPQERLVRDSAVHFLETYDSDKPFCLIVSLVNPHDVLAYPGTGGSTVTINGEKVPLYVAGGYRLEDFEDLDIGLPETVDEDLSTKPKAQSAFRVVSNLGNGLITEEQTKKQLDYVRFYAYLCKTVDREIMKVLDALEASGRRDDTIIFRLSDHGDMAMAHGRQRQKMYNVYQETLNVPFIVSNPVLFPRPESTQALAGLVDVLPTLASLGEVPERGRWTFKGHDLSPVLENPKARVQDSVHFTYDDLYFQVPGANRIRAITEERFKYAVYYDVFTGQQPEYEMYDLVEDPNEANNLAHGEPGCHGEAVEAERQRLHTKLTRVMEALGTTPDGIVWPERSGPSPFAVTERPEPSGDGSPEEGSGGTV